MSDETEIETALRLIFDSMPAQVEAREFLSKLEAAGWEITKKRCKHTGYRGRVLDDHKCPDCGVRVVELGAKL